MGQFLYPACELHWTLSSGVLQGHFFPEEVKRMLQHLLRMQHLQATQENGLLRPNRVQCHGEAGCHGGAGPACQCICILFPACHMPV